MHLLIFQYVLNGFRAYFVVIINSLTPGRPGCHFKTEIFNLVLLIGILTSSKDNVLRWMPRNLTDDKSTLVQVMAWCRQATSHYLSQWWPRSLSPYGVTRPHWVKEGHIWSFRCHGMGTHTVLLVLCEGNLPFTVMRSSLMYSLFFWRRYWTNNRIAGYLKRH